MQRMTEKSVS